MRNKLPHAMIVTVLAAIAHQLLFITEWARVALLGSGQTLAVVNDGVYQVVFSLCVGLFIWTVVPKLLILAIAILNGLLRLHSFANNALEWGYTSSRTGLRAVLEWLLARLK